MCGIVAAAFSVVYTKVQVTVAAAAPRVKHGDKNNYRSVRNQSAHSPEPDPFYFTCATFYLKSVISFQRLPLVPSADNRSKNTKRLHLQRRTSTRTAARRSESKEKPLPRTDPVPRPILRRKKNLAVAPAKQIRAIRSRKKRRSSKTSGISQADGQESGKESL